jgi:hypothetical protein
MRTPQPHTHTQGYVLGQYGLLYALQREDAIDRLFVLNTPLALSSKLRPELAAYKSPLPFMRPGSVSVPAQRAALAESRGARRTVHCHAHAGLRAQRVPR